MSPMGRPWTRRLMGVSTLLGPTGGPGRRGWQLLEAIQRTSGRALPLGKMQTFSTRHDLPLEFLVGEDDRRGDQNRHVVDRTMAEAAPVSRVDHVLVRRRRVELRRDVDQRSSRQERRRIVGVFVDAHPVVISRHSSAFRSVHLRWIPCTCARRPRACGARRSSAACSG